MLKQRIITAVVLLLILLPALFASSPQPFSWLALLLIGAAAWEWGRLNGYGVALAGVPAAVCVALCLASWVLGWLPQDLGPLWWGVGGFWVIAGTWLLWRGVPVWAHVPRGLRMLVGVLLLWVTWLAVVQARRIGVNFLLSVLTLVWMADIFAYFSGKLLGARLLRRRLAPSISPGKSWEGVAGGLAGVVLLAVLWRWGDLAWSAPVPSLYSHLAAHASWLWLPAVLFLAGMSVVGDLIESLVKRSAGVKDSSALLPGHGGVLDRIDALLPTLPLAMLLFTARLT